MSRPRLQAERLRRVQRIHDDALWLLNHQEADKSAKGREMYATTWDRVLAAAQAYLPWAGTLAKREAETEPRKRKTRERRTPNPVLAQELCGDWEPAGEALCNL